MRSREGDKRLCLFCGVPTMFELEEVGPRGGHLGWVDCCALCGEQPARRTAPRPEEVSTDGNTGTDR